MQDTKPIPMTSDFNPPSEKVLDELKAVVGTSGWKSGADAASYYYDPRDRFSGQGCLILLPDATEQVSKIVSLCNSSGVGIIPISGGTGVVAGQLSIDSDNAVIVSLERMNNVRALSIEDGTITVEAGCILENIHCVATEHELMYPLSMASKGSCCIGGNLATNAGGIQVVRFGNARDLCLGIEAVLPNGSVYSALSPLRKDNTGYDLRHLLIGSEGTLGIITAATLVLKPLDAETKTALCAVKSPADALDVFKLLNKELGNNVSALELMSQFGIELVTQQFSSLNNPFSTQHEWYLLVEVGGAIGIGKKLETALAQCIESEWIDDALIAQSEAQRYSLWELRENTPEANRLGGAFCNSDTSVPISKVNVFIEHTLQAVLAINSELRINSYGHIGDGNIHHNVLPPDGVTKSEFLAKNPGIVESVRMAINDATVKFDGSISAEHGIGRLKKDDLEQHAGQVKLDALKSIKLALDPNNILNPGALIVHSNSAG